MPRHHWTSSRLACLKHSATHVVDKDRAGDGPAANAATFESSIFTCTCLSGSVPVVFSRHCSSACAKCGWFVNHFSDSLINPDSPDCRFQQHVGPSTWKNTWLCNELLNTQLISRRRVRWMFEDEMITTMRLFKALAHSKYEIRSCCGGCTLCRLRWVCYQDFGFCSSQLTAALVPPWSGIKIPAGFKFCSQIRNQTKLHWTFVAESSRVDFCQIYCAHVQATFHETLHRFPAGYSWKCTRRQHKICQCLKVFGLAFIEAEWSNCTRAGGLDSNTLRNKNTGVVPCPPHSRSTWPEVACFHASDPSSALTWPSSWPGSSRTSCISLHRRRLHKARRLVPNSLQPQIPRLVCVGELANVRDLQDRASFVHQSYFDTLPCEVLMCSREQQRQKHAEQTIVRPYVLKSALVT